MGILLWKGLDRQPTKENGDKLACFQQKAKRPILTQMRLGRLDINE
jgi:hypothetical protein